MKITFLRHGPVSFLGENDVTDNDPGLTEEGRKETASAAFSMNAIYTDVWTSPMRRARETCDILKDQGVIEDYKTLVWMREMRFPDRWNGLESVDTVQQELEDWWASPWDQFRWGVPGGEPVGHHIQRVNVGLNEVLRPWVFPTSEDNWRVNPSLKDQSEVMSRRVLIVGHSMSMSVMLGRLLGVDHKRYHPYGFRIPFLGYTSVQLMPANGSFFWSMID